MVRANMHHSRRPLLPALATLLGVGSVAYVSLVRSCAAPAPRGERLALRAGFLTTDETEAKEAKPAPPPPKKKSGKLPSQLAGLSEEEVAARKAKAMDIWESMKLDVKDEIDRYQTFRMDKFEKFMRDDSRGLALFELYKPGTPEYAEFFEEQMGPFIFELAQEKLKEGLSQAAGVILVVAVICAFLAYFGTDIIQLITAPFTDYAEQFVELYGF